ncbi:MAG: acyl-CoA carboxylase subunit beta [Gemmatales bacterium]|nr:acyl-CoA carboxylase subunit beta [Gemmatales bacterium]MDW7995839.1 acyl-CoA carboxylase subunit beta [Gemmatales bacterium]
MSELASKWQDLLTKLREQEDLIRLGGGVQAIARQHEKGRLTARERIRLLCDSQPQGNQSQPAFFELSLWAGWNMYQDWGGAPSGGVITGIGLIHNRPCMIIANDATVKAGSFFPITTKKVLRAQRIAWQNRLPLVYLVDSAGVFLPLQDEVFPDEDDFGRIFRNNAVLSAAGIPQFAAIMGNCVAGGGYLPVLCDVLLMTEGSGLYLAGPALVKAAIGQQVSHEELGGAQMHASISGTIDFREPDDKACLKRLRQLIAQLPEQTLLDSNESYRTQRAPEDLYSLVDPQGLREYEVRDVLACILDAGSFDEYKAEYGPTLVCGFATIGGIRVGVVANQRRRCRNAQGQLQYGGVIYVDSANKAARFVMVCNQLRLPIIFFQDVNGFMVGRDAEQAGIIRAGAKLVNVISNSIVPKITVIIGGSFGAGNYALCGKAFDPRFIFAWPSARYAVMGAQQAASTLLEIMLAGLRREGKPLEAEELAAIRDRIRSSYEEQTDVRYAAARLWVDGIIDPVQTRSTLILALKIVSRTLDLGKDFRTGVLQV